MTLNKKLRMMFGSSAPGLRLDALPTRLIRLHEGVRRHAYQDTRGFWTIGIGRNIDPSGPGLTLAECEQLLENDLRRLEGELDAALPWWRREDRVRQAVLLDLCFNMGTAKVLGFTGTLNAWQRGDYIAAADHLLRSLYASQVPTRAGRNAIMLRTGQLPAELA